MQKGIQNIQVKYIKKNMYMSLFNEKMICKKNETNEIRINALQNKGKYYNLLRDSVAGLQDLFSSKLFFSMILI